MFRRTVIALAAILLLAASAFAQTAAPTINQQLLQQLYLLRNGPLIEQTDVTVGTSATLILPLDASRVEDVVSDTGTSNCAIRHDDQVSITDGILLVAGGGSLSENFVQDLTLPTGQMWAICASSGGTLHLLTVDLQ